MKVYISADIEGTCGIVDWEETNLHDPQATYHKEQMTNEVNAACLGANDLGCEDIFVKDAHGSARSINPSMLPENTRILRGWARNPHMMMAGIDEGFDALFKKVEKEITVHKKNYLTEIVTMQKLISAVSDLGLRIQALEAQNSERFKIYLASKRKQIHDYHVNSQTASRYYQNMANSHRPEQSYYFNEKQ